jgi:parallel beta-helix repeat protein
MKTNQNTRLAKSLGTLLFCITLLQSLYSQTSKTFFVDALNGNDAYNGLSENAAWKTTKKLQSIVFNAGDKVLFRCGQVFYGPLSVKYPGVTYSSYGQGEKPVISGFTSAGPWIAKGNGIYETDCGSCGSSLNLVVIDGKIAAMGRYPNRTTANGGYLTIDSHNGTASITDAAIGTGQVWKGAEAVIRKTNWLLDRSIVTAHSGNTLYYITPTGYAPADGYGYFIQNHPSTLDEKNEWYYNPATKKILLYSGTNTPADGSVKLGAIDTLLSLTDGIQDIIFDGLAFEGADTAAIRINNARNIKIINCSIRFSGTDGIKVNNTEELLVDNITVDETNNDAIVCYNTNNSVIERSVFRNTGMIPGMGLSNNQNYEAIFLSGNHNIIQYNIVENTGYSAITFHGNHFLVKNNFVNNYTLTLDDGGGIYTWADSARTERKVVGNIILNGTGAAAGTNLTLASSSNGIYFDDRSSGIEVTDNTIANANNTGLYLHNAHEINFYNNTFFNNKCQVLLGHDNLEPNDPVRNVKAEDNILFSKDPSQTVAAFSSVSNDIAQFGLFDNNYYIRPLDTTGFLNATYYENGNKFIQYHNISSWNQSFGFDRHSSGGFPVAPYKIIALKAGNLFANGSFSNNATGAFCLSSPGNCSIDWAAASQLDGAAIKVSYTGAQPNKDLGVYFNLGSVKANKDYVIRFSSKGANKVPKAMEIFLLRVGQPYQNHSVSKMLMISDTKTEHEYVYHSLADEDVTLALGFLKSDTAFWLDNLQFMEADISVTNPDDSIRFLYNETGNPRNFVLDGEYSDVKGGHYINNILLAPYSSAVLIRTSSSSTVPEKNLLPIADAGDDILKILPADSAVLSAGRSYDPDGSIVGYLWTKISGPTSPLIADTVSSSMVVTDLVKGTYLFRLSVTDNRGAISTDEVTVKVLANIAPSAHAGVDISVTQTLGAVSVSGDSSYDSDGSIMAFRWTRVSGPSAFSISDPASKAATITGLVKGTYVFRLTVTDNGGLTDTDDIRVTVTNKPPVANAGPDTRVLLSNATVVLDGSRSFDDDGSIISYKWTVISGPARYTMSADTGRTISMNKFAKGTYTVRLTVKDNGGLTSSDRVKIIVSSSISAFALNAFITASHTDQAGSSESIKIYPNPVTDKLRIHKLATTGGLMNLRVVDESGRIVLETKATIEKAGATTDLDVSRLKRGVYYLNFICAGTSEGVVPFIKL